MDASGIDALCSAAPQPCQQVLWCTRRLTAMQTWQRAGYAPGREMKSSREHNELVGDGVTSTRTKAPDVLTSVMLGAQGRLQGGRGSSRSVHTKRPAPAAFRKRPVPYCQALPARRRQVLWQTLTPAAWRWCWC